MTCCPFTSREIVWRMAAGHRRDTSESEDLVFTKADWVEYGESRRLRPLNSAEFQWLEDLIDPCIPICSAARKGLLARLASRRLRTLQNTKILDRAVIKGFGKWLTAEELGTMINADQMHIPIIKLWPIIRCMSLAGEIR